MSRLLRNMVMIMSLLLSTATFHSCKTLQSGSRATTHHTTRDRHSRDHRHHGNNRHGNKPDSPQTATGDWATLNISLTDDDNPRLYDELRSWLGTPYRFAAAEKGKGADCSGMVQQVFLKVYNVPLERRSAMMMEKNCKPIRREELAEGDLVFFDTNRSGGITHVGIYLKENNFVHTSSSRGVVVSNLENKYWRDHFHCAGRPAKNLKH